MHAICADTPMQTVCSIDTLSKTCIQAVYLTHEQTPMGTHALQRKHAELNVVNGRSSQPGIATVSWDRGNQEKSINEQIPSGHTVAIFEI